MRTYLLSIGSCLLLTSCFTTETLHKAELDRKNERVNNVLTSYNDTSGNIVIVYTRHNKKDIYKAVVPFDSILGKCEKSTVNFVNRDSLINNLKGVFYAHNLNKEKGTQRIILFNNETPLIDTTGLYKQIENNAHLVEIYKGRMAVPLVTSTYNNDRLSAKPVSFIYKPADSKDSNLLPDATCFITFEPQRRKHARLILVPFAVVLDIVTFPGQIVFVIFALKDVPLS